MDKNKQIQTWYPDILVLGPGGMKGFLELGSLIKLHSVGLLDRVHTYIGCSVGALISLLLICGYNPTEILNDAVETDLFHDLYSISLTDIFTGAGLMSNKNIRDRLTSRVEQKFGFVPTLYKLYLATGMKFIAVTLNLTLDRVEYLSKDTEPNLSCIDAALLSINVPFLFHKMYHKNCLYIDGAFGNPYPVDICDDGNSNILGIYISPHNNSIPFPERTSGNVNSPTSDKDLSNPIFYLYKILHASITQIKIRTQKNCSSRCKHIELFSFNSDITGLSFDKDIKARMLLIGYQESEKFLKNLNSELSSNSSNYNKSLAKDNSNNILPDSPEEEIPFDLSD